MKVAVLQENFKLALVNAGRAVAGRSTLPVLSNILLAAKDGRFLLSGNNLEIGITAVAGVKIDEEGAITVPFKLLSDLVENLPNDTINLSVDFLTQKMTVTCRGTKAVISGIEADEFPALITFSDTTTQHDWPGDLLCTGITSVAAAAAAEHTNPVLQGVLLRISEGRATFAAIDGYRLAVYTAPTDMEGTGEWIIPARAAIELARTMAGVETIKMGVASNGGQLVFTSDRISFSTRVIDGKFPDYERFVPYDHETRTRSELVTKDMLRAIKRIALFSHAGGNIVTLTMEPGDADTPGRLTLTANAAEIGESVEQVDALIEGEGGKLALNVAYLKEAVESMKDDLIVLESRTPNSPGVFKPVGRDGYLHLVMPMRIP